MPSAANPTPKKLPASLVPLDDLAREGFAFVPPFKAEIGGRSVLVTAVLERTVVYQEGSERHLAPRTDCRVVAADVKVVESPGLTSPWRRSRRPDEEPAT